LGGAKAGGIADRLLITKGDIATPAQIEALTTRLQALNPVAAIHEAVQGEIDPELLFGTSPFDRADTIIAASHEHHDHAVIRVALPPMRRLMGAVPRLARPATRHHGEQLLRVKGVLNIAGKPGRSPCTAFTTRSTRRSL